MSTRAAKNMQDDMASMGPITPQGSRRGAEQDRSIAKDLADKGEIMIVKSRAEDELVY